MTRLLSPQMGETICSPHAACRPTVSVSEEASARELLDGLHFIWLELTGRCNLRCRHCYADSLPSIPLNGEMRFTDWCNVLTEAATLGCRQVQFIGGEPTLYPQLVGLLAHARESGYSRVEVFTNGVRLGDALLRALVKYGVGVNFSVYSADPIIHDAVTQHGGSFAATAKSIARAVGRGLKVRASIITMPTDADQAETTKRFLYGLGVTEIGVDRVRSVGRGSSIAVGDARSKLCGACWRGTIAIDPNGRVFPCVFARDVDLGHVSKGLAGILDSRRLRDFRKAVSSQFECQTI